ncbi:hypothetical protein L915_10196 [Phytophthora nicotianae]|uniref:Uncharacterized protein n=1 Tax=Phytophthora nicotianae TaxID=4792 RepID=W2GPG5_PHYNI|nr:hypothetical protein L915_10196 [Phytophthora nicotianae]
MVNYTTEDLKRAPFVGKKSCYTVPFCFAKGIVRTVLGSVVSFNLQCVALEPHISSNVDHNLLWVGYGQMPHQVSG